MNAFRYQAIERSGKSVEGLIEADDRRSALRLLTERGLFPSNLEASTNGDAPARLLPSEQLPIASARPGRRIKRKDVTAFTREMSALLGAAIPIPQALDGLGEEEENPAMKAVVLKVSESVRN